MQNHNLLRPPHRTNLIYWLGLIIGFTPLSADELLLRDGRKLVGIIHEDGDEYVVRRDETTSGAVRVPKYEVEHWEKSLTTEQRYENLRAVCDPNNIAELLDLANWCRQNNLPKQAKEVYLQVIALEPTNGVARRGAGFVQYKNQWLTREEYQRAQGKELYKGEWLERAVAEKKLAEDAQNAARQATRQKITALLQIASKRLPEENVADLSAQLAKIEGNHAAAILQFAASDENQRAREAIYGALAQRDEDECLSMLCKRLATEPVGRLRKKLIELLSHHAAAEKITEKMLEMALQSNSATTRQAAGMVLRNRGNPEIIGALIKIADFCPIPEDQQQDDTVAKSGTQTSAGRPRKPYYPAHQLLIFLTAQKFSPFQKDEWEKWWTENKTKFKFGIGN